MHGAFFLCSSHFWVDNDESTFQFNEITPEVYNFSLCVQLFRERGCISQQWRLGLYSRSSIRNRVQGRAGGG